MIDVTWSVDLTVESDYPCETCGSQWDSLDVTATAVDSRWSYEGRWSVGCYGGASASGFDEVLALLAEATRDARLYAPHAVDELRQVRSSIERFGKTLASQLVGE